MRIHDIIPVITETVETFTSDTGKIITVLKNPTKPQFMQWIPKWHGARCVIVGSDLFMGDADDAYHYQIIQKLGLPEDSIGFMGYSDGITMNWGDKEPDANVKARISAIHLNRSVQRIWGPKPEIRRGTPD